jgi:hypothetical protein
MTNSSCSSHENPWIPFIHPGATRAWPLRCFEELPRLSLSGLMSNFNSSRPAQFFVAGEAEMTEMTQLNRLIQQHILEHESRLKHVDELLERAQERIATEDAEQLAKVKQERDKLSGQIEEFKLRPPDQWSKEEFEKTGPMVVWDTLAQKLEKLVERMER